MLLSVEQYFSIIDTSATILQEELSIPYLEAVAETGQNIFHREIIQENLSEINVKRLYKEYEKCSNQVLDKESFRKAMQLAILKGMKEYTQPNHQMTPDAVGLFVSYLVSKFMEKQPGFRVLEPAVGAGNLLLTVMNQLPKEIQAYAVEIDDTLLRLAYTNANLLEHSIEFFNQDSLESLFIDPVDLVLCDLPVGYYPNDVTSSKYQLRADEGHSYAHHLFIEQSINYTKPGGYALFLVPNFIFESNQAAKLNQFLKEQTYIQGLLQLPLSMFKREKDAKSILILQKKGEGVRPPRQALLAELPTFTNKQSMQRMMERINSWFESDKA